MLQTPSRPLGGTLSCTTGCPTQDCVSWGACMRSKRMAILWADSVNGSDFTTEKQWDKDLDHYANARKQGVQPRSTSRSDVDQALDLSSIAGKGVDYGKTDLGL